MMGDFENLHKLRELSVNPCILTQSEILLKRFLSVLFQKSRWVWATPPYYKSLSIKRRLFTSPSIWEGTRGMGLWLRLINAFSSRTSCASLKWTACPIFTHSLTRLKKPFDNTFPNVKYLRESNIFFQTLFFKLFVAFCKTTLTAYASGFLNLARKFYYGVVCEMPHKPKRVLNCKANDSISNLGESKNFNDSIPPPAPPLKKGRGELVFSFGLPPIYFFKKKVSKKDFDSGYSRETKRFLPTFSKSMCGMIKSYLWRNYAHSTSLRIGLLGVIPQANAIYANLTQDRIL